MIRRSWFVRCSTLFALFIGNSALAEGTAVLENGTWAYTLNDARTGSDKDDGSTATMLLREAIQAQTIISIDFGNANVNSVAFALLKSTPHLLRLRASGTDPGSDGLDALAHVPKLQLLELSGQWMPYGDRLFANLHHLKRLRDLNISHTSLNQPNYAALAANQNLKRLNLDGTQTVRESGSNSDPIGDKELLQLPGLQSLEDLNISFTSVTDSGLKTLENFPNLERLTAISLHAVEGDGWEHLSRLKALTHLDVSRNSFQKGVESIGTLTSLQELDLSFTRSSEPELHRTLQKLKELRTLSVANAQGITDGVVEVVAKLPHLEHLDLRNTKVTDQGLAALVSRAPKLAHVDVSGSHVTGEGVARINRSERLPHVTLDESQLEHATTAMWRELKPAERQRAFTRLSRMRSHQPRSTRQR